MLSFVLVLKLHSAIPNDKHSALNVSRRRTTSSVLASSSTQVRTIVDLPKGIKSALGAEPDNLIPETKDRKIKEGTIPDYAPEGLKKDLEELGIDSVEELSELEEKNLQFFNETGLVPPDGSGTYEKPILIPSRLEERACGYVDPVTHATYWFNIKNDGARYYIQDLGLFFQVLPIEDENPSVAH